MKVYDIYLDEKYQRSIMARGKNHAQRLAQEKYPNSNDLEIKERICLN